jgi:hypothetical protein
VAQFAVPVKQEISLKNQAAFTGLEKILDRLSGPYAVMAYSDNTMAKYLAFQKSLTSLNLKERGSQPGRKSG